jgi:hypothetical protein
MGDNNLVRVGAQELRFLRVLAAETKCSMKDIVSRLVGKFKIEVYAEIGKHNISPFSKEAIEIEKQLLGISDG